MRLLILLLSALLVLSAEAFAQFTEFYIQTTADNLNAGSTTNNAAAFTYAGGTWVSGTGTYTVASGNPSTDGVAAGDWVSIYTTASATVATCIARVSSVTSTTIVVGAAPVLAFGAVANPSATANACTAKVGGAWKGPNAAVNFPVAGILGTAKNVAGDTPRVNWKNGTTYSVTAQVSHTQGGPCRHQGYTTTPGDGGRATFATSGTTGFVLAGSQGTRIDWADFIFDANSLTGTTSNIMSASAAQTTFTRCVFQNGRGNGIGLSGSGSATLIECEFYNNNRSNTASLGGAGVSGTSCPVFIRCIFHDNAGANTSGIVNNGTGLNMAVIKCIFDTNGLNGIKMDNSNANLQVWACEFYNNGGSGVDLAGSSGPVVAIENSNFIKNAAYGINMSANPTGKTGAITNNGFGAGTQANVTAGILSTIRGVVISGSVTYANDVLPWVDAPNGDFRINLTAAKGAGRGVFTQTAASYAGTIGYPDIGTAQHQDTGGGGAAESTVGFSQ